MKRARKPHAIIPIVRDHIGYKCLKCGAEFMGDEKHECNQMKRARKGKAREWYALVNGRSIVASAHNRMMASFAVAGSQFCNCEIVHVKEVVKPKQRRQSDDK